MFTLSGLREGFARGFLSLHRAALSASRKNSANSNYSRTYATPRGWGVYQSPGQTAPATLLFPLHTQYRGMYRSKNVGAPTFLIFPLIFRTFLPLTGLQPNRGKEERSWLERPALHWGIRNRKRGAGPVNSVGAQKARLKDQRYIEELGMAAEASKAWPSARTWSGTRRSSRTRRNQESSFRP
jgi:hypothetical protein